MNRNELYVVVEIITDADGDYPGGEVDFRIRDVCDLQAGDRIACGSGTQDQCWTAIDRLRAQHDRQEILF